MKVFEKFDKWEKLWQDGKNEYLRKSHVSTEILRTILTKGKTGKTLYRIIDSDDRLFYEGIVNLRVTCTTSDIDKLMYISNGVGRKSVAVVEFSKDTLSYEMQKTESRWTDESEHLVFGKFKVSKKSDEIYISGCDIPLIHLYAEPIDQSVDYAKKLIQKRIGHYKEDPLSKQLNDEAILKMFNEHTNYIMNVIDSKKLFENILNEAQIKGWHERPVDPPKNNEVGLGSYSEVLTTDFDFEDDDGTYYYVVFSADAEAVIDPDTRYINVNEDSINIKCIDRETPPNYNDREEIKNPSPELIEKIKKQIMDDPERCFYFMYDEMEERYYSQFPEYYGEP